MTKISFRLLWMMVFTLVAHVTAANAITITSPKEGEVYHYGDTVNIEVDQPEGGMIWIGLDQHLKATPNALDKPPYVFSVSIPVGTSAGDYLITAMGQSYPQNAKVHIQVEPVVKPDATLTLSPGSVYFDYPGPVSYAMPYLDQDGMTSIGISRSKQLAVSVTDPSIARVNANGTDITALARGTTDVIYTMGPATGKLRVVVEKGSGVKGDYNGDGAVDLFDVKIIQAAMDTKMATPNDARDLNSDGKIDALDEKILTTLCTLPDCVSPP